MAQTDFPFFASYCHDVTEFMALGFSLTAWAGKLGIPKAVVNGWVKKYPEFADAVEIAKNKRLEFYERQILVTIRMGNPGAAKLIEFMVKNISQEEYSDNPAEKVLETLPSEENTARFTDDARQALDELSRKLAGGFVSGGGGET